MRNPSPVIVVAGLLLLTATLFGGCDFDASVSYSKTKGDYDLNADAEPAGENETVSDADPEFACGSDEDCNQPFEICIKGFCVPRFERCEQDEDCPVGSQCDTATGLCVDIPADGDPDMDDAPDTDTGDDRLDEDFDTDTDIWPDTDPDRPDRPDRDRDDIADPDQWDPDDMPVYDCTTTGCRPEEGHCNPVTGACEWCDPPCEQGELCNYTGTLWYCGDPCVPPCPDGFACSGGTCIELRCPRRCEPCYTCSAMSGYICAYDPTDPRCADGDSTPWGPATPDNTAAKKVRPAYVCQPAASPCIEGLANCCSGACVMGYCL